MSEPIRPGAHVPAVHTAREARTLGEMFVLRAERGGSRPAYYEKRGGRWQPTSWRQFYDKAASVARGLAELGIEPGDRISILGPTRPRWCYLDLGAQLAGVVSVGIYPKQSPAQLRYLIEHSDSKVLFVDGEQELDHVLEAVEGLPSVERIVPWSPELFAKAEGRDPRLTAWGRFAGGPIEAAERDRRLAERAGDQTAIFVYTSGTTGPPKAAMISHANILSLLSVQNDLIEFYEDDLSFSFLPMAHSAERILGFYGRVSAGVASCFAQAIATVLDDVQEVQPTLFGSVPRIFEKGYARIQSEVEKQKPLVQQIFRWAEMVGRKRVQLWQQGRPIPLWLDLAGKLADRLVFRKVRAAFGGRVRHFVTGAAPLSRDILEFFWAAKMSIYEAYGMTEATVITHANRPGSVRLGTVGLPLQGVEQRIADDGEILLRAPWIFQGYHKNPEATAETIVDGWLHTGDIGTVDRDGYLSITDRKKHLIITAGGKNLTPANIEQAIKGEDPLISQVHAHGDKRPYISALIAPSPIETLEWGVDKGLIERGEAKRHIDELMAAPTLRSEALNTAMARVIAHPELTERVRVAVERGNRKLARVESVRRFRLLDRDFSVELGELTPTMKVKRKAVEQKFAELFDRIYDDPDFGVNVSS